MRPASIFLIIQLSNSRTICSESRYKMEAAEGRLTDIWPARIILSLTVVGKKNRCIPCVYWAAAIFVVVLNYSNLFLPFAFFLDCSHFTFGYELVVCPETAGFMKSIRDLFTSIQWDEPLLLYPGKIHRF